METGVSKRDNLKRPVCHVWSIKGEMKLIFNKANSYNFVIKDFNLTHELQDMAKGTFQIVPFGNAPFPNGNMIAVASGQNLAIFCEAKKSKILIN